MELRIFFALVYVIYLVESATHYCPSEYSVQVLRHKWHCRTSGWFFWKKRNCYQVPYYVSESRTNPETCCRGYKGSSCEIPICSRCQNNAVCVSPNKCYCRPGSYGSNCGKLAKCGSSNDCYPGTCNANFGSCSCASGYSGSNCENILSGGEFEHCRAFIDYEEHGRNVRKLIGRCSGSKDPFYHSYYSNLRVPIKRVVMDYEVQYPSNQDFPPLPSEYMVAAPIGLTGSTYNVKMYSSDGGSIHNEDETCHIKVASGQSPPSTSNPHQALQCQNVSHTLKKVAGHHYKIKVEVMSTTGGHKKYKSPSNEISTRSYNGRSEKQHLEIVFDIEPPYHCSKTKDCQEPETDVPSTWLPDITPNASVGVMWYGWNDSDSGISGYSYDIYKMFHNPHSSKLVTNGEPIKKAEWKPNLDINEVKLPKPGMYSMILTISDFAGNEAKTRSLVLYHDSSPIEAQESHPVKVAGAEVWDGAFWFTKANDVPITVSWHNRYINRFLHDNHLLAAVEHLPNHVRDGILDDTTGNRTVEAINNVQGVVRFEYYVDYSGDDMPSGGAWINNSLKQEMEMTQARRDGQSLMVFIRAVDVFERNLEEKYPIHIDSTKATLGDIIFKKNFETFGSILSVNANDLNSGIRMLNYSVIDTTGRNDVTVYSASQPGQKHPEYATAEECKAHPGQCYCTPMGHCYNKVHSITLDHCAIKDRLGHDFSVKVNVMNGAGLTVQKTKEIGILKDLKGINVYPPVKKARIIDPDSHGTKATVAWIHPKACYSVKRVVIVLHLDQENNKKYQADGNAKTFELDKLRPETKYIVQVYVDYEGGVKSEPQDVTFTTGKLQNDEVSPDGLQLSLTANLVIGLVVAVVILLVIMVIGFALLYRKRHKLPMVPNQTESLAHTPSKRSNNYSMEPVKENENEPLKVSYVNTGEEDDIYYYATMETDPKWKVSDGHLTIQDPLPGAKGRLADIRLATLRAKNGSVTVVAKMNKAGASEEDVMLLTAKMNYIAVNALKHECILRFVGAITPPQGPIILTEYCDQGKLSDYVNNKQTSEGLLINFCQQIAAGMKHLHHKNILHRRLGARNVLLKTNSRNQLVAKVTGFGPMKGETAGKENEVQKERVPIKWLAPEQLNMPENARRSYTKKTDVWTYGITLHEIFNNGAVPFDHMKMGEFKKKVQRGYKMLQGADCPDHIYKKVMLRCWALRPEERPDFEEILKTLNESDDGQELYGYDVKEGDQEEDQDVYELVDYSQHNKYVNETVPGTQCKIDTN